MPFLSPMVIDTTASFDYTYQQMKSICIAWDKHNFANNQHANRPHTIKIKMCYRHIYSSIISAVNDCVDL
jgi:hypothetical protein